MTYTCSATVRTTEQETRGGQKQHLQKRVFMCELFRIYILTAIIDIQIIYDIYYVTQRVGGLHLWAVENKMEIMKPVMPGHVSQSAASVIKLSAKCNCTVYIIICKHVNDSRALLFKRTHCVVCFMLGLSFSFCGVFQLY